MICGADPLKENKIIMFEKVDGETEYFDEQTQRYHSNHSKQESLIYLAEKYLKCGGSY